MNEFRTHSGCSAIDDNLEDEMAQPLMRVLTLWQPWASLVIAGAKPFEFRGKRPPSTIVGQRVVIHVAKKPIDHSETAEMFNLLALNSSEARGLCLHREQAIPILNAALEGNLPFGCGLGTAVVGEARNGFEIAENEFGATAFGLEEEYEANWGWPLTEIVPWSEPIPARGKQGIWFWPRPKDLSL